MFPIENTPRVVVVSGAGVSVSAGLPTYRDPDGVWSDKKFEKYSHATRYGNHLDYLVPRWVQCGNAMSATHPTVFHYEVARQGFGVITQNVDGLHVRAGSEMVTELHGTMMEWTDYRAHKSFPFSHLVYHEDAHKFVSPYDDRGKIRPNVVLFGERVKHAAHAQQMIANAEVVVYVGTSGTVEPVSSWYQRVPHAVLVNPQQWGHFDTYFPMTADEWALNGCPLW